MSKLHTYLNRATSKAIVSEDKKLKDKEDKIADLTMELRKMVLGIYMNTCKWCGLHDCMFMCESGLSAK